MNHVGGHSVGEDPGRWIEGCKGWSRERFGDLWAVLVSDGWRNALLLVLQKKKEKERKSAGCFFFFWLLKSSRFSPQHLIPESLLVNRTT